ncbi:MAG: phosphoribosylformylglycinamidine cyclo-ligase [Nitrospiria bacterium]
MAGTTYKGSGVDIEAGDRFVREISPLARSTFRPEVLTGLGGFSGLFGLRAKKYKNPILVSGTDGVGTKLKVAFMANRHDTVGIDLVAMCVNDIIVSGAEPLFFLDYLACGKLLPKKMLAVVKGISEGCRQAGCALLGGETAEMPSFYPKGEYDLAGFAVGVVEKREIIHGKKIRPKDLLIGLASSGLHSNGYSLVRKVFFEKKGMRIQDRLPDLNQTLGEELLTPTTIYVRAIQKLKQKIKIKGAAHITGGGLTGNIPRALPEGCAALIRRDQWKIPPIFEILKKSGRIDSEMMYSYFNMGIGMVLVVSPGDLDKALPLLKRLRQEAFVIGEIIRGDREVRYV